MLSLSTVGNFPSLSVQAISGTEVSYPFYGLEEITLPSDLNTAGYMQVVETLTQLWVAGASTNASEQYRGGIWNHSNGQWVKFRTSAGSAGPDLAYSGGYRTWTMFNDTHHFVDEAGYGGKRVFTNNSGTTWYETTERALLGMGVQQLPNGTFVVSHWGDNSVWKSDDLMTWNLYKNITQWWIDQGLPTPDAFQPHMCAGVSKIHKRLYVNYEFKVGGIANHTTIFQNLDTGEWSLLNYTGTNELEPPRDNRAAGTTFCQLVETSQVVVHGDTDRDAGELKIIKPSVEDRWFFADALQQLGLRRGSSAVGQFPHQLASKNDVIYVAVTGLYHILCPEFNYAILVSPDHGVTWGMLLKRQATDGQDHKFQIWGGARHLYIFDSDYGKLYSMQYLSQDEAWAVINSKYVSRSSSTITFEKTLSNQTTDMVDFSQYGAISDAIVTLIGQSYYNKQGVNSGYEWGNMTGYGGLHISKLSVVNDSSQAYEGFYYGNLTAIYDGWHYLETSPISWTCGLNSKGVVGSVYVKWNGSSSSKDLLFSLCLKNSTDGSIFLAREPRFSVGKSWQRINVTAADIKKGYDQIFLRIRSQLSTDDSYLTDAWMIEEANPLYQGVPPSDRKKWSVYNMGEWFTNELKTQNPTVIINNQPFSHSDILDNGAESTAQSMTVPPTGMIDISSITVSGSGLVKVKVQATAGIIAEGIFLREKTNNVYVGHYYNDSYTFTGDGSSIVAFCDPLANITYANLSADTLTFTVSTKSERTSTTKVYAGYKGRPTSVTGASSWSFDNTTKILTVISIHPSPATIIVEWIQWLAMTADLVRRGAWPEHHRFQLSKDGDASIDDKHGTPGYQTLYGMVKNTGNVTIPAGTYSVAWNINDSTDSSRIVETIGLTDLAPGETTMLTYNISATDLTQSNYHVQVRGYYHYTTEGEKVKTFSFTVVP